MKLFAFRDNIFFNIKAFNSIKSEFMAKDIARNDFAIKNHKKPSSIFIFHTIRLDRNKILVAKYKFKHE